MTHPNSPVTLELSQVEASLIVEYLRAAASNAPMGHAEGLNRVRARIADQVREAQAADDRIRADRHAKRERLAALENEAREAGRTAGYNHANYVYAYGGDLATEDGIIVPDRYQPVASMFVSAFLEGQETYEREWAEDCG